LCAAEVIASGMLEIGNGVWAEVGQGMTLEPSPQILDGVQIGTVGRQEGHLA